MLPRPTRTPMLFSPPQAPLPIGSTRSVVIGRSRTCDLCVPSADASRRHCEVAGDGREYVIRDLGSRNGTFVNGERLIRERRLRPGDRIEIGSHTITFCELEADVPIHGPSDDAETQIFTKPTEGAAFKGDLAEIPPFAVLQVLEMGLKTGVLELTLDDGDGRLWLTHGRPTHAEMKQLEGFDAAVALVNANRGSFIFEPQTEVPNPTIDASVTDLLLEASRILDEGAPLDATSASFLSTPDGPPTGGTSRRSRF